MSEQNAYDAEVRRIAEIIVENVFGGYKNGSIKQREYMVNRCMDAARAMVAEMAKHYEFAYFSNYGGTEDSEDYALWNRNCIYEMQDRGLIPLT